MAEKKLPHVFHFSHLSQILFCMAKKLDLVSMVPVSSLFGNFRSNGSPRLGFHASEEAIHNCSFNFHLFKMLREFETRKRNIKFSV